MTSQSAWIGCELPASGHWQPIKFAVEVYIAQAPVFLQRTRATLTTATFVRPDSDLEPNSDLDPEMQNLGQLEANLTSVNLREPLFSLNNLRPATNYALQVRALNGAPRPSLIEPALVRFSTSRDSGGGSSSAIDSSMEPSLEPIAKVNQPQLLQLLISTRSTNARREPDHRQDPTNRYRLLPASAQQPSAWTRVLAVLRSPPTDGPLMPWLAAACLLLVASLATAALLLQRCAQNAKRRSEQLKYSPKSKFGAPSGCRTTNVPLASNSLARPNKKPDPDATRLPRSRSSLGLLDSTAAAAANNALENMEMRFRQAPKAASQFNPVAASLSCEQRRLINVPADHANQFTIAEPEAAHQWKYAAADSTASARQADTSFDQQANCKAELKGEELAFHRELQISASEQQSLCKQSQQRMQLYDEALIGVSQAVALHGSNHMIDKQRRNRKMMAAQADLLQQQQQQIGFVMAPQSYMRSGQICEPLDQHSTSLMSDESSDSTAHCTWSMAQTAAFSSESPHFVAAGGDEMHFIELLPSNGQCLDVNFMNKLLNSNSFKQTQHLAKQQLSPSDGSLERTEPSPSSQTNTTISNADSNGLQYDTCNTLKRNTQHLASILKNNSRYQTNEGYPDRTDTIASACQCNGDERTLQT